MTTSPSSPASPAAALLALHAGPGFILPNAWDAGSARVLEGVGFPALATTSAGVAWSLGLPDGGRVPREVMLAQVSAIVAATAVPVSADLEAGYATSAIGVAETVGLALEAGVVGANLEDIADGVLFSVEEGAERIAAARSAAPSGTFVLNARTDTYFAGDFPDPFAETITRAHAYLEAGADCIFVPGVRDADTIGRLAREIPAPLNIVAGLANTISTPDLFALGVRRVSLGGSLARAAFSFLERAGQELVATGTLGFLDGAISYADLQERFGT